MLIETIAAECSAVPAEHRSGSSCSSIASGGPKTKNSKIKFTVHREENPQERRPGATKAEDFCGLALIGSRRSTHPTWLKGAAGGLEPQTHSPIRVDPRREREELTRTTRSLT